MKTLITGITGGRPFNTNDLDAIQNNSKVMYDALANAIGLEQIAYILKGCVITVNGSGGPTPTLDLTAGAIWYNDEIYEVSAVIGQALPSSTSQLDVETTYQWDIISTQSDNRVYKDLVANNTILNKTAELKITGSTGQSNLQRVSDFLLSKPATQFIQGIAEIASQTEVEIGIDNERIVTPLTLNIMFGGLKRKVIDIGPWNMDTVSTVAVPHGLATYKIRNVSAIIIADGGAVMNKIDAVFNSADTTQQGGIGNITFNNVNLYRLDLGIFDSTNYNDPVINRGYIVIDYVA